jgi:outer membrane protein assembly factor BamB
MADRPDSKPQKSTPPPKSGASKDGPAKRRWWHDRRKLAAAIAGSVLVLGAGAAIAYNHFKRPGDVSNPDVPFKTEKPSKPVVKTTNWPMYGYNRRHTRYLPATKVKPPFKRLWKYGDRPLIEFPPIFVRAPGLCERRTKMGCQGRLYFVDNNGNAYSLDANTGKILWHRQISGKNGNASSPTYARGRLYLVTLSPGQVMSLDAKTGKTIWRRSLPGRSESSPIVVGHKVIFGCENGQLFAVSDRNGKTKWTAQLAGPVKGSPAYDKGVVFVGDYGGEMSAVRARNGHIVWQASSQGLSFSRQGEFYSTPAVAFGRVYSGNNDARIYSFDEKTGALAWSYSTGSYAYGSTSVANTKATGPTVYVGSYDGNLYALNAKTGQPRWTQSVGGPVIGSTSVIGNIVYVATFQGTTTNGYKLSNGKKVVSFHTGAYHPVISDGRRIYLTGYSSVQAMQPYEPKPKNAGESGKSGKGGGAKKKSAKG